MGAGAAVGPDLRQDEGLPVGLGVRAARQARRGDSCSGRGADLGSLVLPLLTGLGGSTGT